MNDHGLFDLSRKVALITGASRGIGEAIAVAYAQAGAKVVLASCKQSDLENIAQRIREAGGEALPLAAHTGDAAAISGLVEKAISIFGGIDILVNNAAINPHFGNILTAEDSHWDKILQLCHRVRIHHRWWTIGWYIDRIINFRRSLNGSKVL